MLELATERVGAESRTKSPDGPAKAESPMVITEHRKDSFFINA
jgi:hypothetical protein